MHAYTVYMYKHNTHTKTYEHADMPKRIIHVCKMDNRNMTIFCLRLLRSGRYGVLAINIPGVGRNHLAKHQLQWRVEHFSSRTAHKENLKVSALFMRGQCMGYVREGVCGLLLVTCRRKTSVLYCHVYLIVLFFSNERTT